MKSHLSDKITATDFGIPEEYAANAENYANWVLAKEKRMHDTFVHAALEAGFAYESSSGKVYTDAGYNRIDITAALKRFASIILSTKVD